MGDELQPLVSVIVPAYNAADYLEQTLKSILRQTYSNLEVLVVDDGSTDATAAIAKNFIDKDERFQLIQQENRGVAAARNYGIQVAKGEFIAPIDADDIWHEENIGKQVKKMLEPENNAVGMVFSWSADIDKANQITTNIRAEPYYGYVYPAMLLMNITGHASASMIRRSCLEDVGTYNTTFFDQKSQGSEDWDLYIRIAEKYDVAIIPELLVGYRQTNSSMSHQIEAMSRSRIFTLKDINVNNPKVYSLVIEWANAYNYLELSKQCLSEHCYKSAWKAFVFSFKSDWLMTLAKLSSYSFCIKLIYKYLISLFVKNINEDHNIQDIRISSGSKSTANITFLAKRYIYISVSHLLPARLLQFWRIKWISSQIKSEVGLLETVEFGKVFKTKISILSQYNTEFFQALESTHSLAHKKS